MPRSLRVRENCVLKVKSSLLRNGFPSQRLLAEHLEIAQSTVSNFLNGTPVDLRNFLEICRVLGQEWRDIANFDEEPPEVEPPNVRFKIAIGDCCSEMAEIAGSNISCRAYFEQYLLPQLDCPLTLGLDEVDCIFPYQEIADDFFGLLRALHEEAKRRDIWKRFRLIVVHSTEVYVPLDMNKSPFNVGLPIELPEFTSQQVLHLARRHGLDWNAGEVEKLMALVGGHPYLLRLAMYAIARQDVTLDTVLLSAPTEAGLYSDHLRRHLWNLEKHPQLMEAMREVAIANSPVRLPAVQAFKLNSMGLVRLQGNEVAPRCHLYEQYFRERLGN